VNVQIPNAPLLFNDLYYFRFLCRLEYSPYLIAGCWHKFYVHIGVDVNPAVIYIPEPLFVYRKLNGSAVDCLFLSLMSPIRKVDRLAVTFLVDNSIEW